MCLFVRISVANQLSDQLVTHLTEEVEKIVGHFAEKVLDSI